MGTAFSGTNLIAKRYAAALLDLAAQDNLVERVEKDLAELAAMIAGSKDLKSLIGNPLTNRVQQKQAVLALAEKAGFQKLSYNFLGVLADNRRLALLESVIAAFAAELKRRRGVAEATVETAYALSPAQTRALADALSKAMGSNVTLNVTVNKDLLGGMIVTAGSRMFDDSVRRKLERLQRAMGAGKVA